MTRTEKMTRIAAITTATPSLHFSGYFDRLGDELVVWESRADWGEIGWMVGVFNYYELGPWMPGLSTKVFCRSREEAMVVLQGMMAEEKWNPRTMGDLSTAG